MSLFKRKPNTGYEKQSEYDKHRERKYLSNLTSFRKKVPLSERIIKILIYIGLRIAIRPRKWKDPTKNIEIIDRTYKRIISPDFTFIPSSIAFYIIMGFLPVVTLITFSTTVPGLKTVFSKEDINKIIGDFIPGFGKMLDDVGQYVDNLSENGTIAETISTSIGIGLGIFFTIWIAAGGFSRIIFTQSYLYDHKYFGGFWANKFKGMFIVILGSFGIVIALIFNIYLTRGINSFPFGNNTNNIIKNIALIITLFILIMTMFISVFKFTPRFKIKIKYVLPGAIVATIPTTGFLGLFGFITRLWNYSQYGSIGSIMYIGTSSLIISYFLFVGLIANVAYYNTFVGVRLEKKWTISRK